MFLFNCNLTFHRKKLNTYQNRPSVNKWSQCVLEYVVMEAIVAGERHKAPACYGHGEEYLHRRVLPHLQTAAKDIGHAAADVKVHMSLHTWLQPAWNAWHYPSDCRRHMTRDITQMAADRISHVPLQNDCRRHRTHNITQVTVDGIGHVTLHKWLQTA